MKPTYRAYAFAAALSLAGVPALPIATLATAPSAHADQGEPPPEFKALREEGIALHDTAREGDEGTAERAVEALERYLERFPEDAEARAYLGSAYALMGRDASSVANKMRYANRGLRHLDRALDAAPRKFPVRMIRAYVNASLPKLFGRADEALADMLVLDEIYREAPSPMLARMMIRIYEELQDRAPDAGPWAERLEQARALSEGG